MRQLIRFSGFIALIMALGIGLSGLSSASTTKETQDSPLFKESLTSAIANMSRTQVVTAKRRTGFPTLDPSASECATFNPFDTTCSTVETTNPSDTKCGGEEPAPSRLYSSLDGITGVLKISCLNLGEGAIKAKLGLIKLEEGAKNFYTLIDFESLNVDSAECAVLNEDLTLDLPVLKTGGGAYSVVLELVGPPAGVELPDGAVVLQVKSFNAIPDPPEPRYTLDPVDDGCVEQLATKNPLDTDCQFPETTNSFDKECDLSTVDAMDARCEFNETMNPMAPWCNDIRPTTNPMDFACKDEIQATTNPIDRDCEFNFTMNPFQCDDIPFTQNFADPDCEFNEATSLPIDPDCFEATKLFMDPACQNEFIDTKNFMDPRCQEELPTEKAMDPRCIKPTESFDFECFSTIRPDDPQCATQNPQDPRCPRPEFTQNPDDPGCPGPQFTQNPDDPDCPGPQFTQNPDDPDCPVHQFTQNPEDPECPGHLLTQNPDDPDCPGHLLTQNPEDPECPGHLLTENPNDPDCPGPGPE